MIKKIIAPLLVGVFAFSSLSTYATSPVRIEQASEKTPVQKVETFIEKFAKADEDVLSEFHRFYALLEKGKLSAKDEARVLNSLCFALEKHKDQSRSNAKKTPYIIHPIAVAERVMQIGNIYDVDIIIAAILHDVMDDTGTSYEEITKKFGSKVSSYVQEMSDDKSLSLKERKKKQIIQAFHQSEGASIIKLADKYSNLTTLLEAPPSDWSRDRIDQYFQWAQSVVENLPNVNPPLKDAVKKVIEKYWVSQK